jgi:hypothetical protein
LMNAGGEARVGADLFGRAETLHLADFRHDRGPKGVPLRANNG